MATTRAPWRAADVGPALRRDGLVLPGAVVAAALYGLLAAHSPMFAVALVGGAAVLVLAFAFPVAHFTLLLIATAIVPYTIQNQLSLGGGTSSPGLVFSDVLLLTGLLRAAYVLLGWSRRLSTGEIVGIVLITLYLVATTLQFIHGVFVRGTQLSQSGDELRSLNGLGAMLVALPLLRDERSRRRLLVGLLIVGLALGLWGMAQWTLHLGYSGGFGVRQGTGAGAPAHGQIQGGLYGFPVAVVLSFAALLSGELRRGPARWAVIATLALNGVMVVLTFERTFLLVALMACALTVLRARPAQRTRALLMAPIAALVVCVPLAVLTPGTLTAARERMFSLGQYGQDQSVLDRLVESRHMIAQIKLHPVTGSGLGAAIWWGRPENQVPPRIDYFGHNAYLWITWKLGLLVAALLFGSILLAGLRRGQPRGDPLFGLVAVGAQCTLLALLVACVTFPAVTARPITPTMGLLLAMCALPRATTSSTATARS